MDLPIYPFLHDQIEMVWFNLQIKIEIRIARINWNQERSQHQKIRAILTRTQFGNSIFKITREINQIKMVRKELNFKLKRTQELMEVQVTHNKT